MSESNGDHTLDSSSELSEEDIDEEEIEEDSVSVVESSVTEAIIDEPKSEASDYSVLIEVHLQITLTLTLF